MLDASFIVHVYSFTIFVHFFRCPSVLLRSLSFRPRFSLPCCSLIRIIVPVCVLLLTVLIPSSSSVSVPLQTLCSYLRFDLRHFTIGVMFNVFDSTLFLSSFCVCVSFSLSDHLRSVQSCPFVYFGGFRLGPRSSSIEFLAHSGIVSTPGS